MARPSLLPERAPACPHEWDSIIEAITPDNTKHDYRHQMAFRVRKCRRCGERKVMDYGKQYEVEERGEHVNQHQV